MHILVTADTLGGGWTYTRELVTGLVRRGDQVTLVSFGDIPTAAQTRWMDSLANLDYRPTAFKLEWMLDSEADMEASSQYLLATIEESRPDLLHFSQFYYGTLPCDVPRIVVAHSDVVSWWVAVHGKEPDDTPWIRRYRNHVTRGLRAADVVVAPSRWMLDAVKRHYVSPAQGKVIHNGRTSELFERRKKDDLVLSVGRIWDQAKHVSLLLGAETSARVCIVGWEQEPGRESKETLSIARPNVELLGQKSQDELQALFADAAIYAATSRYEPFGLAPLEAALSGCALVMSDNPVFHELWGDAAVYFRKDDASDLARAIADLRSKPHMRDDHAERCYKRACEQFTASRMVEQYEAVYEEVCSRARVA